MSGFMHRLIHQDRGPEFGANGKGASGPFLVKLPEKKPVISSRVKKTPDQRQDRRAAVV